MSICTITESAKKQINTLCEENKVYGISLNIKGGGCAGFEYDWGTVETEDKVSKEDEVINTGSGNFIIGAYSLMYLAGTEVDYVRSLVGSNFEIRNPNAKSSCGCGVSVNFDMDMFSPYD
jgi:iron-sulfur cluster assembly accessory protein